MVIPCGNTSRYGKVKLSNVLKSATIKWYINGLPKHDGIWTHGYQNLQKKNETKNNS